MDKFETYGPISLILLHRFPIEFVSILHLKNCRKSSLIMHYLKHPVGISTTSKNGFKFVNMSAAPLPL